GIYLLQKPSGRSVKLVETTRVTFRKLSDWEIEKYLKTKEPYDKAGAYGIQGKAGIFVKKIEGCYFNVVGLPINKLLVGLRKLTQNSSLWFKKL
ncbi:MAG: Maf family protein, partial [candidate division WOR-3 bacterium]|nr:Maf family protein [candidate division WOR-3 bacterium]